MKIHLAGLVAAMQLLAFSAMAATFYVAEDGSDSNVGTNGWDDALLTIGSAVGKAVNYDTILVSNGTYTVPAYMSTRRWISAGSAAIPPTRSSTAIFP